MAEYDWFTRFHLFSAALVFFILYYRFDFNDYVLIVNSNLKIGAALIGFTALGDKL